jgi:hypothetical protein
MSRIVTHIFICHHHKSIVLMYSYLLNHPDFKVFSPTVHKFHDYSFGPNRRYSSGTSFHTWLFVRYNFIYYDFSIVPNTPIDLLLKVNTRYIRWSLDTPTPLNITPFANSCASDGVPVPNCNCRLQMTELRALLLCMNGVAVLSVSRYYEHSEGNENKQGAREKRFILFTSPILFSSSSKIRKQIKIAFNF